MNTLTNAATPRVYEHQLNDEAKTLVRDIAEPSGTYYREGTPRAVIDGLERALRDGSRIRFWYGDTETGRNWMDEYDVTGTVGRSMGPIKIPLLIRSSRSHGGGAIMADCIVKLRVGYTDVYTHPQFSFFGYSIGLVSDPVILAKGYTHEVFISGETTPHARFKSELSARRWLAFMRGERGAK